MEYKESPQSLNLELSYEFDMGFADLKINRVLNLLASKLWQYWIVCVQDFCLKFVKIDRLLSLLKQNTHPWFKWFRSNIFALNMSKRFDLESYDVTLTFDLVTSKSKRFFLCWHRRYTLSLSYGGQKSWLNICPQGLTLNLLVWPWPLTSKAMVFFFYWHRRHMMSHRFIRHFSPVH